MTLQDCGADGSNFFFGNGEGHGHVFLAGVVLFGHLLEEGNVAGTVQGVHDNIRLCGFDLCDDSCEIGLVHIGVFFTHHRNAGSLSLCIDDHVGGAGEHVVGTQKEQLLVALGNQVLDSRNDLLVRSCTGVDNVRRHFHTFVLHRVPEQRLIFFEDGLYSLTGRRSPAAEYGSNLFDVDQLFSLGCESRRFRSAIFFHENNLLTQHAAGLIDLFNSQNFCVADGLFTNGHRTGEGVEQAYLHSCGFGGSLFFVTAYEAECAQDQSACC